MSLQLAFQLRAHDTSFSLGYSDRGKGKGERDVPLKILLSLLLIFPETVSVLELLPAYGSHQDLLWLSFELQRRKESLLSAELDDEPPKKKKKKKLDTDSDEPQKKMMMGLNTKSQSSRIESLIREIDGFLLKQLRADEAAMHAEERNFNSDETKKSPRSNVSPLAKHLPQENQNAGARKKATRNNSEWVRKHAKGKGSGNSNGNGNGNGKDSGASPGDKKRKGDVEQ